jgi:hypothetical protein
VDVPMKKGFIELSMKFVIPLILGLVIIIIYFFVFGPQTIINLLNSTFNFTITTGQ